MADRTQPAAPHVDWIPSEAFGFPARLGLTAVPGGWGDGGDPEHDRRLSEDLRALATFHGARALVTLLEPHEIADRLGPRFPAELRRAGLEPVGFPITDGWVPVSTEATLELVAGLLDRLRAGETVVVHCMAGLGRTGTVAACCLTACGHPPGRAIALVRAARPGAVQTDVQAEFVFRFAEAWSARGDASR